MKASLLALGATVSILGGCGGTVVFEENGQTGDGGSGGQVAATIGSSGGDGGAPTTTVGPTTTTSVGPTTTTSVGPTTTTSVGPTTTTSVGPSSSSGHMGCGSLSDDVGFDPSCASCMEGSCCGPLLNCDQGTDCWDCIFNGTSCNGGQQGIDVLVQCLQNECDLECNGPQCEKEDFFCESGECIPGFAVCDGILDCQDGSDEFCGCPQDSFQCPQSGECIPDEWVCDGVQNCGDGADEESCNEPGICDSGLSAGDPQLEECLELNCCEEFEACTAVGSDLEPCLDCLNNGGGPLCDAALECANSDCIEGNVLITPPGVAYGHHGDCEGWNQCGDAETCAQWACQSEGYGTLVSFGEDRPCPEWDTCHLFYDGCCNGIEYNWDNDNDCDVRGVSEIRCAP